MTSSFSMRSTYLEQKNYLNFRVRETNQEEKQSQSWYSGFQYSSVKEHDMVGRKAW